MDGDLSPRVTENEKKLQFALDEGEQRECLELMKEKKMWATLVLEQTTTDDSGPSTVLTQLSKVPGIFNHQLELENELQKPVFFKKIVFILPTLNIWVQTVLILLGIQLNTLGYSTKMWAHTGMELHSGLI